MPIWQAISFQDRNSPVIEHLLFFHDHTIVVVGIITIIVLYTVFKTFTAKHFERFTTENTPIEVLWTNAPAIFVAFIGLPSIKILYLIEETINPLVTVKATGHQWYWSYDFPDFPGLSFDAYIEESNTTRLLETSNHLILPILSSIRILVTSDDVIHSWTIPSLGIKVDAVPGRINQLILFINRPGILTGQCREICGANHRFIPIVVSAITPKAFISSIYTEWPRIRQRPFESFYS